MGALLLTLDRLGWQALGPFSWADGVGYSVTVTSMSPALSKSKVKAALYRVMERSHARRLCAKGAGGTQGCREFA